MADLLEKVWDKAGVAGVVGLLLFWSLRRLVAWLEPRASQAFVDHSALVTSLTKTTEQQAATNAENSKLLKELTARPACRATLNETAPQNLRAAIG